VFQHCWLGDGKSISPLKICAFYRRGSGGKTEEELANPGQSGEKAVAVVDGGSSCATGYIRIGHMQDPIQPNPAT